MKQKLHNAKLCIQTQIHEGITINYDINMSERSLILLGQLYKVTIQPSNSTPRIYPGEIRTHIHSKTCKQYVPSSTICKSKTGNDSQCLSKDQKENNMTTGEKGRCTPEIPAFGRLRQECKFWARLPDSRPDWVT